MNSFLPTSHGETKYWFKESRDSWSGPELLFSFEPVLSETLRPGGWHE